MRETPIAALHLRLPVPRGGGAAPEPGGTLPHESRQDLGRTSPWWETGAGVTLREATPTLKDIVYGAAPITSRAIFVLDIASPVGAE